MTDAAGRDTQTKWDAPRGRSRAKPWRRTALRGVLACFVAASALVAVGCSSDSTTSSASTSSTAGSSTSATYPAGKEEVCQARDQLKTSVEALTKPTLLAGGSTAIKAAVDQVQTDLDALKAAAKTDYQSEVDALQTALKDLQTSVGNLGDGNLSQNLQTVGTDIAAVGTTSSALFTVLKTSCGS